MGLALTQETVDEGKSPVPRAKYSMLMDIKFMHGHARDLAQKSSSPLWIQAKYPLSDSLSTFIL